MAFKSTSKCQTIVKIVLFMIILAAIVAFLTFAILFYLQPPKELAPEDNSPDDELIEPILEPEPPVEIDFQPTVDEWVNSVGGSKGIIIYDLELDRVARIYNADEKFQTASLYKLFVVYEGYRRIQNGVWDANEIAGWTNKTISQCLDLAIRESHSPCAETLWSMIGHEELNEIVSTEFEIPSVVASSLMATPTEIMLMMKRYYNHPEIVDETLLSQLKDSFLNQPITTYNWRQGLPSGFSERVDVYNKVGWYYNQSYWAIYDDAAILDFVAEERHFIAVVMTSAVTYQQISQLGSNLETAFYNQYVLKN